MENHLVPPPTQSTTYLHQSSVVHPHHPPQFPNEPTSFTCPKLSTTSRTSQNRFSWTVTLFGSTDPIFQTKPPISQPDDISGTHSIHPDRRHPPPRLVLYLFTTRQPTCSHPFRNGLSVR